MSGAPLVAATFLASGVEAVEALTIVLAVGITRGWRSTLIGVRRRASCWPWWSRRSGPAVDGNPDRRAAGRRRRAAAGLRAAVAVQGHPAGERPQGPARRGRDLPRSEARGGPGSGRRARAGSTGTRSRSLQGRAARGPRGRVHRRHVRRQRGAAIALAAAGAIAAVIARDRAVGVGLRTATGPRARERDEARRRAAAGHLRDVLGPPRARAVDGRAATPRC